VPRAVEDLHRMRQKMRDGIERFHGTFGTPRQVHNQRLRARGRKTASEHGGRCQLCALAPHLFGDSGNDAIRHRLRGFRRDISSPDARSAGRQDQIHAFGIRKLAQLLANV